MVKFDYQAQNPNELTIHKGEKLQVRFSLSCILLRFPCLPSVCFGCVTTVYFVCRCRYWMVVKTGGGLRIYWVKLVMFLLFTWKKSALRMLPLCRGLLHQVKGTSSCFRTVNWLQWCDCVISDLPPDDIPRAGTGSHMFCVPVYIRPCTRLPVGCPVLFGDTCTPNPNSLLSSFISFRLDVPSLFQVIYCLSWCQQQLYSWTMVVLYPLHRLFLLLLLLHPDLRDQLCSTCRRRMG